MAWDPVSHRVWLICTRCGGWNLLNPAAGSAGTAELRHRLPIPQRSLSSHYSLGKVEVLVIDPSSAATFGGAQTTRHLRLFRGASSWGPLVRLAPLLWIALIAVGVDLFVSRHVAPDSVLFLGCVFVGHLIASVLATRLLEQRWSIIGALAAAAALIGLLFATRSEAIAGWFDLSLALTLVGLSAIGFAATDLWFPTRRVRSTHNGRIRFSPVDASRMLLRGSATDPGIALYGLPGASVVEGQSAADVLMYAGADLWGRAGRDEVEAGWVLARSSGSLGSLVSALDDARPQSKDAHLWSVLPHSWKVAFYLCAVEAAGHHEAQAKVLKRIRTESEVAAIAEALDGELGSRSAGTDGTASDR